jgi:hypothetical protein
MIHLLGFDLFGLDHLATVLNVRMMKRIEGREIENGRDEKMSKDLVHSLLVVLQI